MSDAEIADLAGTLATIFAKFPTKQSPHEKSLKDATFRSIAELREHTDAFSASYNENAKPFVWTKIEVFQKRIKPC